MAKITPFHARSILRDRGINPDWDFHTLKSTDVDNLLAAAKFYGYRKPRNANGSKARYFHAYLVRLARKP